MYIIIFVKICYWKGESMSGIKRMGCIILALLMVVIIGFDTARLDVSAEVLTIYKVVRENVNLRKTPTTSDSKNILTKITNSEVEYISEEKNDIDELWYKVSFTDATGKKYTGYIRSDYVKIERYTTDESFESTLKLFPESYRDALTKLHAQYPNWKFIADQVNLTFNEAVALENQDNTKQVDGSYLSYRTMGYGSYDWGTGKYIASNGGWYGASREMIQYYMDPRNFLDSTGVIMFLQQGYDAKNQTLAGIKTIIKGTFLENGYTENSVKGDYANDILEAAKKSMVSPYVLASMIIQEQGVKGTSDLISGKYKGYVGYYNFFNVKASGTTTAQVVKNGLEYAKSQKWNSRKAAIIGGAQFYANGYINKDQDTFYYKNFNVHNPDELWHQYAQAVHDSYSSAKISAPTYTANASASLTFKIPVYKGEMPKENCKKPAASKKQNNYYFTDIDAGSGLSPSFNKFTYKYTLEILGNTNIGVTIPKGAKYSGKTEFSVKKGKSNITLTVTSETGYKNDYIIQVVSTGAYKVTVEVNGSFEEEVKTMLGDINGDNKISVGDLAAIQMHLLSVKKISSSKKVLADINKDNKISVGDLAAIQMHLLGVKLIGE